MQLCKHRNMQSWKVCHLWIFKTTKKWNLPSISLFFCTNSKLLSQNIRWRHVPTCCIQASCWDLYTKRKQKQMSGKTWNKKSERSEKSCRKILSDGWSHSPSSTVLIVFFTECILLWLDQAIHILLENYLSELMILIWRNLLVRIHELKFMKSVLISRKNWF